jgi:hypothetical protein
MKYSTKWTAAALLGALLSFHRLNAQSTDLRIVLLRHAEKPKKGDNLTCQGLNRALKLPPLLHSRFGLPVATYVPAMGLGDSTKHSRMFQTIQPFAVKYNLPLTTKWAEDDTTEMAREVLKKTGTVFIIWEHSRLPAIARNLGIRDYTLSWSNDDYDSIWIISYHHGVATLTRSKEGLKPATGCPF